ncbi:uncharacterized protein LOC143153283 isoform X1 [Ptiloglossa arizonensis]|uniref:uncharacterized protein LOC143153283 isoform X1 n=1 Tax=Ptiloglossa arizonensis TaxID=3350558 RepID=UPI003FA1517F
MILVRRSRFSVALIVCFFFLFFVSIFKILVTGIRVRVNASLKREYWAMLYEQKIFLQRFSTFRHCNHGPKSSPRHLTGTFTTPTRIDNVDNVDVYRCYLFDCILRSVKSETTFSRTRILANYAAHFTFVAAVILTLKSGPATYLSCAEDLPQY